MDEYLLEVDLVDLFVSVVDAELLETVMVEDFKPVDVQKFDYL